MARLTFELPIVSAPLASGTEKTVSQLLAATNQRVALIGFGLFFDDTNNTHGPVQIRILRQTSAGTSLVSVTLALDEPELTETIQSTGLTASQTTQTEPTAGTVLRVLSLPAYLGAYEVDVQTFKEIIIGGAGRLGFACNAPNACNVRGYTRYEE